jgi:hypothetical protein
MVIILTAICKKLDSHYGEETIIPTLDKISDSFSNWFSHLFGEELLIDFDRDAISVLTKEDFIGTTPSPSLSQWAPVSSSVSQSAQSRTRPKWP